MESAPYNFGVCIAGGKCPGTAHAGNAIFQREHSHGNKGYIIRGGLSAFLENKPIEKVDRGRDSYVGALLPECSRKFIGPDAAKEASIKLRALRGQYNMEILYVIGGDGTAAGINFMMENLEDDNEAPSVILLPKTIDGDVADTDRMIGFSTARGLVDVAMKAHRNDAAGHERIYLYQTPGRDAGHLAFEGGRNHAHVILIPEASFAIDDIAKEIVKIYESQRHAMVSVAEGFVPKGIDPKLVKVTDKNGNNGKFRPAELLTEYIQEHYGDRLKQVNPEKAIEAFVMGSPRLRGADPNREDIDLGVSFARHAADTARFIVTSGKQQQLAIAEKNRRITNVPLHQIANRTQLVTEDSYPRNVIWSNTDLAPLT